MFRCGVFTFFAPQSRSQIVINRVPSLMVVNMFTVGAAAFEYSRHVLTNIVFVDVITADRYACIKY